ncbi:hypothetical protein COU58_00340 [Candidatus Pacearchaeota archaeon CG10_big_fil_rev_8_21_14_0_10_32_42]|nr:MAG: hypothetical protein COU58_00340 [Candidatus Pacearchaeota archaeon CG10_big_fil_rev_8_21_14_0_10_32_42]
MKKRGLILFLIGILLISPLILAEEQAQTYSSFDRFIDNAKLFFSSGNNKVNLALEIREKEVNSAIENAENKDIENAEKNIQRARNKLLIVQEKVSVNMTGEVKESSEEIIKVINEKKELHESFETYILEEEKTKLTAEFTEKTYEYCKELSKEDYNLMLNEEECNPNTAQEGLEKELENLKDLQERMFVKLMLEIRSCIDDPGTCNCDNNLDIEQKAKCEKMVALAVKCEYKNDETSCVELEAMKPAPGDGFARSFVPDFLMNLFSGRNDLIEYGLEHSDGVPEECWNENDKLKCEKYAKLKEDGFDWDEYGNYLGTQRGKIRATKGIKEPSIPTMEESIPQCFDDGGTFLKEKCGKITIVWNEEGLINYLIGTEIDNIIDEFENKSEQHLMEIRGGWMMVEGKWVVDPGQKSNGNGTIDNGNQTQNKVWEIKQEMNRIQNQIAERTYAEGTGPGGDGKIVYEGGQRVVVETGEGTLKNDPLPVPDLNQINPDLYDSDAGATTDIIDGDTGENIIEGGNCGDGVDCGDGSAEPGTEGTNDVASAVESNSGDDGIIGGIPDGDGGITGAVIDSGNKESFLVRLFKKIFEIKKRS